MQHQSENNTVLGCIAYSLVVWKENDMQLREV